jgi:transcription initiation factor TFIID TATA-box-binding protein
MVNPKVTFLIFGSGRIICTGAKTITDLKESVEKLYKNLKKLEK